MSGDLCRRLNVSAKYELLEFLPDRGGSTDDRSNQCNTGRDGRESGETSVASSSIGSRSSETLNTHQFLVQNLSGNTKKRDSKELNSRSESDSKQKVACRGEEAPVESALTNAFKNVGEGIIEGSCFVIADEHSEWGEYVDVEDQSVNTDTSQGESPKKSVAHQMALNAQLYENNGASIRESQSKVLRGEEIAMISEAATTKWNTFALEKRDRYAMADNAQERIIKQTQIENQTMQLQKGDFVHEAVQFQYGAKTEPLKGTPSRSKPSKSTRSSSPCVRVEKIVRLDDNDTFDELSRKSHGSFVKQRGGGQYDAKPGKGSREVNGTGNAASEAVSITPKTTKKVVKLGRTRSNSSSRGPPAERESLTIGSGLRTAAFSLKGEVANGTLPVSLQSPISLAKQLNDTDGGSSNSLGETADASSRAQSFKEEGMIFDLELDEGPSHYIH